MDTIPRFVIITPCHNEERYLPIVLETMVQQTVKPEQWIIVDDNSTDSTPELIKEYADRFPWIIYVRREVEKGRDLGVRVVQVFNTGMAHVSAEWDVIMKMDADLRLPPDCFEKSLRQFDDPDVGMAGIGLDLVVDDKKIDQERYALYHVPGNLKMYRRQCFEDIGGLAPYHGWDIIDCVEARRHGWKTLHDPEVRADHMRIQGKDLGLLKGRMNWGRGAYMAGSHWLFTLGRSIYRMIYPPYIIGGLVFFFGYMKCLLSPSVKPYGSKEYRKFMHKEQLHRLFNGNRLPPDSPAEKQQ